MVNGVGPSWFPSSVRDKLTKFSLRFFNEASWSKHDIGYKRGNPSRYICDMKFLQAMLRDASKSKPVLKILICVLIAWFYWIWVRLLGWISYKGK